MSEWKKIVIRDGWDSEPKDGTKVLVSTSFREEILSLHTRLSSQPVAIAYMQANRWWTSEMPGAQGQRLWFDPDIWMEIPDRPEIDP